MMRVLVTAGPTREYFDSVRFISNPSSGKMGYAIAAEAARRGHEVVLISGPVPLPDPPGVTTVRVTTADEMFDASIEHFAHSDAAIMTAAVCDYAPAERLLQKLKKQDASRTVELRPTRDICAHLGAIKGGRVVIGFAMEDHDHRSNAEAKLLRKRCDAIVLNGISNVGSDSAEVEIFRANGGWTAPERGTKCEIAVLVLALTESLHTS